MLTLIKKKYIRWDKQTTPVPATFTFAILNSLAQKSFVVSSQYLFLEKIS